MCSYSMFRNVESVSSDIPLIGRQKQDHFSSSRVNCRIFSRASIQSFWDLKQVRRMLPSILTEKIKHWTKKSALYLESVVSLVYIECAGSKQSFFQLNIKKWHDVVRNMDFISKGTEFVYYDVSEA